MPNSLLPIHPARPLSRRELLFRAGAGFSGLALTSLLDQEGLLAATPASPEESKNSPSPLAPRASHFPAKAKSVIFLFMYGGPSQVDLFDPKPMLQKMHGQPLPTSEKLETFNKNGNLMASPYEFKRHGQSGIAISELFPHLGTVADDLCVIKSLHSLSNNHSPAIFLMNSGNIRPGNPSLGSWVTYGLGTENQNLPAFIVMYDWRGGPIGGSPNWSSGFMPAAFQGTSFRPGNTPIVDLVPPKWVDPQLQRREVDLIQQLNREHRQRQSQHGDLDARIASYELAFQMQTHAPEAVDLSSETPATRKLYGIDEKHTDFFGRQCLTARRLVERGVRFIQLYHGGGHQQESWDAHFGLDENHRLHCKETDLPITGLLRDLKARGLLDSTLVVWGGEFGRMPMSESGIGRDHNNYGFTMWMAGGGIQGGQSLGETDEFGLKAAVDPYSVHDLHATILHALGLQHQKLTYYFGGRNQQLTNFGGDPILKVFQA
ncbi:MAG: DUF1501 domain-containing protein [Blastocatellia bacterium]|jgi:hypothetical protein